MNYSEVRVSADKKTILFILRTPLSRRNRTAIERNIWLSSGFTCWPTGTDFQFFHDWYITNLGTNHNSRLYYRLYGSRLEVWTIEWRTNLASRCCNSLAMHNFGAGCTGTCFCIGKYCHAKRPNLAGCSYYWIHYSAYRGKVWRTDTVHGHLYVRICQNLQKIIVRKCGKDNSPHWSRCFVVISYLPVALLIAANCVWVAGLAELSQGVNWRELSVFFEMSFIFISSKILPKLRHTKVTQLN